MVLISYIIDHNDLLSLSEQPAMFVMPDVLEGYMHYGGENA